ncbi:MAG TPA: NAD-dependent epimerase/dehydratase family protein [Deltaproteobacteria bacterium]|nr:NAD-dependent epimerase/dehydratase family protein [Deltaproteobacteria bacterium]
MADAVSTSTLFLTGGSGYIGRNLLRAFVADGFRVRALARSEKAANVVSGLGAEPVRGDLLDVEALKRGMAGAGLVIHAAADTDHGMGSTAQAEVNLQGTRNVYEVAKAQGVQRALHLSTEAVLLDGRPLRNADETTPIPEKHAGGYSKTKAEAERIALAHSGDGLDVIVVRPRFVWGRDDTTALPQLIEAARSGKLSWIGGGHYEMSTTHIANVVHGVRLALEKGRGGEVYFITDGRPVGFRTFITALLEAAGVEPPTTGIPRWIVATVVRVGDFLARLTGGRLHGPMSRQEYAVLGVEVTLDIDKARRELGYAPIITREEGLAEIREATTAR